MGNAIVARDVSKRFVVHAYRPTHLKERFVRGRSKSRGEEFWALKDVSFEIEAGSAVGIIGHNGSGKSTALKVLAGIYRPTSGDVSVTGRVSALLELGAGFHPELTGRENIRLNAAILGLSEREIAESMDEIIDFAGIDHFIDSPVKVYSSGMVLRLGFAIAARMRPDVLIVDEIIAVGDEEFQRKCFDYLHQLRRDGATVLLVSHSMGAIESICDRAIWLDHGVIRQDGPAKDVVRSYMEHVNAAESDANQAVNPDGLIHRGSGEAVVKDLHFLNRRGEVVDSLVTGEPATLRLRLSVSSPVARAEIGLSFLSEGVNVAGPSSSQDGGWSFDSGDWTVDFAIGSLHLHPGLYDISVTVTDGTHLYDAVESAFTLPVRGVGGGYQGLTAMPGEWLLSPVSEGGETTDLGLEVDLVGDRSAE